MKQSLLVKHPFWTRKKPTKKDKEQWVKAFGVEPQEIHLPNKKYFEFMEKLLT